MDPLEKEYPPAHDHEKVPPYEVEETDYQRLKKEKDARGKPMFNFEKDYYDGKPIWSDEEIEEESRKTGKPILN